MTLVVEFQQPIEDFVLRGGAYREPLTLRRRVETMIQLQVTPAVGACDCVVQLNVKLAETLNTRTRVSSMDAVVNRSQAFTGCTHQGGSNVV